MTAQTGQSGADTDLRILQFPARLDKYLAIVLEIGREDALVHEVRVEGYNSELTNMYRGPVLKMQFPPPNDDSFNEVQLLFRLDGVSIPKSDFYRFDLKVDAKEAASIWVKA